MKKTFLILLVVLLVVLCLCAAGCGLFGKPDNPPKPDGGKTYELSKLQVGLDNSHYIYDGSAHTPAVSLFDGNVKVAEVGKDKPHDELAVAYADNVEVGTAKVTVTAKSGSKKFSGRIESSFEIRPNQTKVLVGDFATLKQRLDGGKFAVLELSAELEIPAGERIEISSRTALSLGVFDLVNNGEVVNKGSFVVGGSFGNAGHLINHGKFVNAESATFTFDSYGGIIHDGQFENYGQFERGKNNFYDSYVYADTEINVNFPDYVRVYNRKPLSDESVTLQSESMPYTGNVIVPSLTRGEVGKDYEITCGDSVNAGSYTATFTATKYSKYYTGQAALPYAITPIAYKTAIESAFLKAVQSPNYNVITYDPEYHNTKPKFSLLEGVTLNITDCNPTIENIASGVTINFNDFCTLTVKSIGENATLNFGRYCDIAAPAGQAITLGSNAKLKVKDGNSDTKRNRLVALSNVTGEGSIGVGMMGELFFGINVTSVGVPIENAGIVYSNFELNNVTNVQYGTLVGAEVVRRQLTAADVTVTNPEYTGENVKVTYVFDNRDDGNSALYYKYDGVADETRKILPKEVGDYQAELRFSNTDKNYFGIFEFDFKVAKGAYSASDSSKLTQAIESGNYDRYVITGNWWNSKTLELPAGETFTARATLTNNGAITVNGTLIIEKGINSKDKSITVKSGGKIVFNGNFFNSIGAELTIENGATVENNGKVYLSDRDVPNLTGDSVLRKDIRDATFTIVENAVYNERRIPTFTLHYGDALVDESVYTAYGTNCDKRTTGDDATLTITVNTEDENYFGVANHSFAVLGGSVTVYNGEALVAALNDDASETLCNYETITLASDTQIRSNTDGTQVKCHVKQGTTFVVKSALSFYSGESSSIEVTRFDMKNDGVIEVHGSGRIEHANVWQQNGTGTFKLFVNSASDFSRNSDTAYYDEIILENDVTFGSGYINVFIYASNNGTKLNLNNHTVTGTFSSSTGESRTTLNIYTLGNEVTVSGGTIKINLNIAVSGTSGETQPAGNIVFNNIRLRKEPQIASGITVEGNYLLSA